ncbi:MAG TPA: helix-turn-helix domain-containing protein [Trebonia sp.]|nr:helix-turn-helix domain-containing protein [Trebonia sp.]
MPSEQMSQDLGEVATGTDFVRELQSLRERSGLTIREVARAAGTSVSTTGDYFSGRHMPLDREQFARILAACGETGAERVEAWQAALARVRRSPGRRGDPPYRGLARFEADDERWFFGREDFTELIAFLAEQRSDLPLMLVGASGAGKSSLLRAGLLPRLRAAAEEAAPGSGARIEIYDLTVTGTAGLAQRVIEAVSGNSGLSGSWGGSTAWDADGAPGGPALIVDQFEALFTLCPDEGERSALISALCDLAKTRLVVLALRADFYGQAIGHPGLLRALQERHVLLAPMSAEQVRRAVVEPARLARTDVEDGLVEVVLADIAPPAADQNAAGQAHEPGTLPLLSHAMRCAWEHSRGGTMTVADYLASGGIKDAVTQSAERAYESLTPEQQLLARRLLLRLVHVADELPPSRASVPLSELRGVKSVGTGSARPRTEDSDTDAVLDVFVRERMITVDADSAQFTHDALLTAWPRLRTWIEENAEALRARRRIAEGARAWTEADREEAALWRGSQLAVARDWSGDPDRRATLSPAALAFIDASVASGTMRERRERRRLRRLRGIVAVLAVLVLAVAGLTAYTTRLRQQAVTAENTAIADGQAANSRAVAFVADEKRNEDPAVSAQLAAAAYSIYQSPQATASLLEASGTPEVTQAEDSAGIVQWVSLSPDRRLLVAAGADGTLRLWNITQSEHPVPIATLAQANSDHPLYTAAFSPDGTLIAAAGAERVVRLWRVAGTAAAPQLTVIKQPVTGPDDTIYSVAFSPDGKTLAAGSADGSVWLWNVSKPGRAVPEGGALTVPGSHVAVNSVGFGAGGQVLAAGTSAGTVMLWRVRGSSEPVRYPHMPLTGPGGPVSGVAFSPDGQTLAASSQDDKVWLWTVHTSKKSGSATAEGTLTGATNWANTVAFSPDGTSLAAGTSAANVLVWNLATRALTATVPQPQPVTSVTWDGPHLIAASNADGTIALVRLPSPVLATGNSPASVAYSPDGKTLAVGGTSVQLWDASRRTLLAVSPLPSKVYVNATAFSHGVIAVALSNGKVSLLDSGTLAPLAASFPVISAAGAAESVAFSPDGTLLATGADDGSVRLYDVADPAHPRRLVTVHGSGDAVYTVAFAPNGKTVAAASLDNVVRLWQVTGSGSSAAGLSAVGSPLRDMASYAIGLAFSPDSKTLAVGSADKTVHLWDVANPAHPVLLGPALTGPSGYVWAAAFSPSGRTLAVGVTDGSVWLWNVASPAHPVLIATLTGPADHVYGLAFSPSGAQLAATSFEGTVHLWDTSPSDALTGVCAVTGQQLTEAEWASYVPGVPYRAPCP